MTELHPTAAAGFEAAADLYDRHRPGYPPEAVEVLARELPLAPGQVVLDLAAGTGKLTRELAASGADVVAVEPVAAMRRVLATAVPAVAVIDGTAEAIPLPDATMDAATVAQAFHWFDADRAIAELGRVLRPSGALAVVFNRRDLSTPVQAAVDDLLAPDRGATPSWADQHWQQLLDDVPTGFSPVARLELPHSQAVDLPGLLGRVASVSFVATLPAERTAAIETQLRALFDRHQVDGQVVLAYRTQLWVLRREA